ncbi:MAG: CotH kinase family protein [candidate division Zixibacteria bacterium]
MKLKEPHPRGGWVSSLFGYAKTFPRSLKLLILIGIHIVVLLGVGLSGAYYGMMLFKRGDAHNLDHIVENIMQTRIGVIGNYIKGLSSHPDYIQIDIKFKDFQKLVYDRAVALEKQILISSSDNFVPAEIRYGDDIYRAKIRLKGDWTKDNLQGDKWSYRVKIRGDSALFGMKQFSLHHPRARDYVYEWLFQKALAREKIVNLRYKFVRVSLNGKDVGIYALEEHFEKRLIEHTENREGPIIKFNENLFWQDLQAHWHIGGSTGLSSLNAANIDMFKSNTILNDPILSKQFFLGHSLLEKFRHGELPAREVFDIPKTAMHRALIDLMGGGHALSWHNLRFYYNPITSRLEPIGFDNDAGNPISHLTSTHNFLGGPLNDIERKIFADAEIFREYVKVLEKISQKEYLDSLLTEVDDDLQENLRIIYSEFPYFHYSERILYNNQQVIQAALRPTKAIHAYLNSKKGTELDLEIGNIQLLPVEIRYLSRFGQKIAEPSGNTIFAAMVKSKPAEFQNLIFKLQDNLEWTDSTINEIYLNYSILGSSRIDSISIFSWKRINNGLLNSNIMHEKPNPNGFEFLDLNRENKTIIVRHGNWKIDRNMIIPPDYKLICLGGTTLNLINDAAILSYSPLYFTGEPGNPVKIISADSTGQGLIIVNADSVSVLEYVIFDNLSNPAQGGWAVSGAVNFFESPVEMRNCILQNNQCEDYLNIIRTEFVLENLLFKNSFSDAFDGDFVKGTARFLHFENCGNDALDVSGSIIKLTDITIDGAGDKGISAGENSQIEAYKTIIENAEIAVASKDMSSIAMSDLDIIQCRVGFAVYQKKPEFGPGTITVDRLNSDRVVIPYLVEDLSKLIIDNTSVTSDQTQVKEMLYGVEYGKSSK